MPDSPHSADLRRTHVRLQGLLDQALDSDLTPEGARTALQELGTALEELRVAEEELTTQSEQLAASAAAIDEERERYAELFEFAPDAYIETDEMGKIIEANRAAADLLGVPSRLLSGKLIVSYVEGDERRRFRQVMAAVVAGARAEEETIRLRTRDDREVVAGVTVARQDNPTLEGIQLRWLLRDLTSRVKLESQVEDLSDEVDLLNEALEIQRLIGDDPLAETLTELVAVAQQMLAGVQVGVSLEGRPDLERALSTGDRAQELDLRQREAGDGPCIHTLHTGEAVRARPQDWPVIADATDVAEVVAIPMVRGDLVDGALNIYSFDGPLDDHQMHLLTILGRQAAVALQNAALYSVSTNLARNLAAALETRGVIERAKGLLMARSDIDDAAAFEVLRSASQRENVKLHDIARRIVEHRTAADD